MAQSLFGGATNYHGQSKNDILEDLFYWVNYTKETQTNLSSKIEYLKSVGYYNTIPLDFKLTLESTLTQQKTILEDLEIIINSIKNNIITDRDVTLLNKIGINAVDFNNEYGLTYKKERYWKNYGDPLFKIAEDLYADGRDYFIILQDATNASARLKDYITPVAPITQHNINQTISGNGNQVSGITNGNMIQSHINSFTPLIEEINSALSQINQLKDIDDLIKEYVTNTLNDTSIALKTDDIDKQTECKYSLKAFFSGAGTKALNILSILSSFASISSFFGLEFPII